MAQHFVNLTPHNINIVLVNGEVVIVEKGDGIARVASSNVPAGTFGGVQLFRTTYGAVEGLPEPQESVMLIVSAMVRGEVPNRSDVASPGQLLRDQAGNVIGCQGLVVN